jgi:hypothetical protein
MQLPKLNCIFFDELFPIELCSMQQYTSKLKRETELVLHLLSQKTVGTPDHLLHTKLDLLLLHTLGHVHPNLPNTHMCRLGLDSVILPHTLANPNLGDALLMRLFIEPESSWVIHLPMMISKLFDTGIEGHLSFTQAHAQADWEQWIFQKHRLSLQKHTKDQEKLEIPS